MVAKLVLMLPSGLVAVSILLLSAGGSVTLMGASICACPTCMAACYSPASAVEERHRKYQWHFPTTAELPDT